MASAIAAGTWRVVLLVGVLVAALCAGGCDRIAGGGAKPFNGTDLSGSEVGGDFSLADATGKLRNLAEFRGRFVAVFFGYTHCPDVCPTALADLARVRRSLGADGARLQVLFVTLDPVRDSGEAIAKYLQGFDPTFIGLRGDEAATRDVAKRFRIFFEAGKAAPATGDYAIQHSSGIFLLGPDGKPRLFFGPDATSQTIEADLRRVLAG